MDRVWGGAGLVGVRWPFHGVMVLAITDWQPIGGYERETVTSLCSSVGSLSAGRARPGALGNDS